jgi:hypothetical protein
MNWHPNSLTQASCDLPLTIRTDEKSWSNEDESCMAISCACQMRTRVVYEHRRTRQEGQLPQILENLGNSGIEMLGKIMNRLFKSR